MVWCFPAERHTVWPCTISENFSTLILFLKHLHSTVQYHKRDRAILPCSEEALEQTNLYVTFTPTNPRHLPYIKCSWIKEESHDIIF